jgi:hypothetical protein
MKPGGQFNNDNRDISDKDNLFSDETKKKLTFLGKNICSFLRHDETKNIYDFFNDKDEMSDE